LIVYWNSRTTGRLASLTRFASIPSYVENTASSRNVSTIPAMPTA
jgi:hypothetical protein